MNYQDQQPLYKKLLSDEINILKTIILSIFILDVIHTILAITIKQNAIISINEFTNSVIWGVIYFLSYKDKLQPTVKIKHILIFFAWINIFSNSIVAGGIYSSIYFWLISLPLFGSYLDGKRGLLVTVGYVLLSLLTLYTLYIYQLLPLPEPSTQHMIGGGTQMIILISLLTLFMGFSSYIIQNNLDGHLNRYVDAGKYLANVIKIVVHNVRKEIEDLNSSNGPMKELYQNRDSEEEQLKHTIFRNIERGSDNIIEIINKIKINAELLGKANISIERIRPEEIIEQIHFLFDIKLREKKITLETINLLSPDDIIFSDKTLLINHIISNLISNAIKFSHQNNIVTLTFKKSSRTIQIEISDSGIGITPIDLGTMLKQGNLISRKGTSKEEGTGYGTQIAFHYSNLLDHNLTVKSRDIDNHKTDHGTTFIINIKERARR